MQNKIRELLGLKNIPETDLRKANERTPWDITFLRQAIETADRSHDAETKCGCILTLNNTILSGGYNGFIRDIDDTVLPNLRPHKYPFMLHAEWNAILNCARLGKSTLGATCYVTTKPCLQCFQSLWQAGIIRIVYTDWSVSKKYNNDKEDDQIQALEYLINEDYYRFGGGRYGHHKILTMEFIPKNDVLPK